MLAAMLIAGPKTPKGGADVATVIAGGTPLSSTALVSAVGPLTTAALCSGEGSEASFAS